MVRRLTWWVVLDLPNTVGCPPPMLPMLPMLHPPSCSSMIVRAPQALLLLRSNRGGTAQHRRQQNDGNSDIAAMEGALPSCKEHFRRVDGGSGTSLCSEGKCRCCHSMACDGVASAAVTAAADGNSGSGATVVPS